MEACLLLSPFHQLGCLNSGSAASQHSIYFLHIICHSRITLSLLFTHAHCPLPENWKLPHHWQLFSAWEAVYRGSLSFLSSFLSLFKTEEIVFFQQVGRKRLSQGSFLHS